MTIIKPQLADDANLDKLVYPVYIQPKIDGVRALHLTGQLTGRSLDPFKGFGVTEMFSDPEYAGLDGEMILGSNPASAERLCSLTTGAMGRFKGVTEAPDLHWCLFDLVTPETVSLPYRERYIQLTSKVHKLKNQGHHRLRLVPYFVAGDRGSLDREIAYLFDQGYEGAIIRNPEATYKAGRPTKDMQLMRVKGWSDFEILVTGITEGARNENAAKLNTLGKTERSSAQAGQVPNGQVGSIQGTMLADFHDPITGKLLFAKGLPVTAGRGEMSVAEATDYFQHPEKIVGHIAKIKTLAHGVKDLPRFPTFQSLRLKEDLS